MGKRVCAEPGCPELSDGTRCVTHKREHSRQYDATRPGTTARGYGARHQRIRADYQRQMDAGSRFICWRCAADGEPHYVDPNAWHLGHDDQDRSQYRGPECPAGNLATAPRRAANIPRDA